LIYNAFLIKDNRIELHVFPVFFNEELFVYFQTWLDHLEERTVDHFERFDTNLIISFGHCDFTCNSILREVVDVGYFEEMFEALLVHDHIQDKLVECIVITAQ